MAVIGAALGGLRTVQALRAAGHDGEIVLVGAEPDLPYDRPPLSKAVLSGERPADDLGLATAEELASLDTTLLLGRHAERLDVAAGDVVLDSGDRVPFDDLVVATGTRARPSPWGLPPGAHLLRTRADAVALRSDLVRGGRLVVVGAGVVGCEVAATARTLGLEVTLVDPLEAPMVRVVGPGAGAMLAEMHRSHGVRTRFGARVEQLEGTRGALRVRLADGEVLDADTVVVGIGAEPNDGWLAGSGLEVRDGLVCDEFGRASGVTGVYAVGDVARWWHPRHQAHVRLEHWTNAGEQAAVVGHNIVHPDEPRSLAPVEYVWSDQFDRTVQVAGRPEGWPAEVVGDDEAVATGRFTALFGPPDGPLTGMVAVGSPRSTIAGRRAIATGTPLREVADAIRVRTVANR
ncbi:NAD(P)/FAD-dependent oxidoreductase [Streptomyces radicis]|uniref:NAD(P)/FAD-dependent oxidoreductase n=1 Tax=Streptomyces radicis TaxID=1750517 RepID=UPI001E5563D6|nr:FAD-dependent oxidoreductase [Streptomyces radicis]